MSRLLCLAVLIGVVVPPVTWGGPAQAATASKNDHAHHAGHPAATQSSTWTAHPLLTGAGGGRGEKMLRPVNMRDPLVALFPPDFGTASERPDGGRQPVTATARGYPVSPAPGSGGYHWAAATGTDGNRVTVATTVVYFSNPGPAPRPMLRAQKHELEIIPDPLPREHGHYRAAETWRFLLRFRGRPLAGQTVHLETEQGDSGTFTSDGDGFIDVAFPAKLTMRPETGAAGHHPRRPQSGFVLAASHQEGGKAYLTTFHDHFTADPFFNKNRAAGMGFMAAGMILATPLVRRSAAKRGPS